MNHNSDTPVHRCCVGVVWCGAVWWGLGLGCMQKVVVQYCYPLVQPLSAAEGGVGTRKRCRTLVASCVGAWREV